MSTGLSEDAQLADHPAFSGSSTTQNLSDMSTTGVGERYQKVGDKLRYGTGSIDFGSFKTPVYDYDTDDSSTESSSPLGDSPVVQAALNKLADPFPKGIPKRPDPAAGTSPTSTGMPTTADEALAYLGNTVYNPKTKQWEKAGANTYPLDKYYPDTSSNISKTLLFGSPNADVSDMDMGAILSNAGDVQASVSQLAYDNPTANAFDIAAAHHENFTGFDSSGNFTGAPVDPGTKAMNAAGSSGGGGGGGGVFGDGYTFSFNKGGSVPVSNGGK